MHDSGDPEGYVRGALADGERVMGFGHRVFSYVPVGVRLLDTPAVAGDLAARGIDTTDRFFWELFFITDAECVTVRDRNPWNVLVKAPTPHGTLGVTLDGDAAVRALTVEP